jgi:hypothetical protein
LRGCPRYPRVEDDDSDIGYSAICEGLQDLQTGTSTLSTHLPRIGFATWWPIRVLCVRHPFLLDELPYLQILKIHPFFHLDALQRLGELIRSSSADSTNIVRQIMGHATASQYISVYCRSWSLQASIQSYLAWKEGRCPGYHRLLMTEPGWVYSI